MGGAALAARQLRAAGRHGLAYGCTVAGRVAAAGFVLVAVVLPDEPAGDAT